jgi:hypothetical protein
VFIARNRFAVLDKGANQIQIRNLQNEVSRRSSTLLSVAPLLTGIRFGMHFRVAHARVLDVCCVSAKDHEEVELADRHDGRHLLCWHGRTAVPL